MTSEQVMIFTVHVVRPDTDAGIEIVFLAEEEAREYAIDRSRDFRVASASVTRFQVGQLGTRHPVTWFVDGAERSPHEPRPGRLYPEGGRPTPHRSGPGLTPSS